MLNQSELYVFEITIYNFCDCSLLLGGKGLNSIFWKRGCTKFYNFYLALKNINNPKSISFSHYKPCELFIKN